LLQRLKTEDNREARHYGELVGSTNIAAEHYKTTKT
jgi:hypothetical protein